MVRCFLTGAKELNDDMLIPIISNNHKDIYKMKTSSK